MEEKYNRGSVLEYDNGSQFLVCENVKVNNNLYLLVSKLKEDIKTLEKIEITNQNIMMLKISSNDETEIVNDEETVRKVYGLLQKKAKNEMKNTNQ